MTVSRKNTSATPHHPGLSAEDARLWQAVTADVRPMADRPPAGTETRTGSSDTGPPDKKSSDRPESQTRPAPGKSANAAAISIQECKANNCAELDHASAPGLDRRNHRRLQKGKKKIEARLDLHGRTEREAHKDLNAFIRRCYDAEKRCVLVITGKGLRLHSGAIGILRRRVPQWLNENPLRPLVLAFTHATPRDGGEGALYVLIKRKR